MEDKIYGGSHFGVSNEKPKTQNDGVSIEKEPLLVDELTRQAAKHKGRSKRGGSYTKKDDQVLCEAWMEIGQDPICGAKQKGGAYWKRGGEVFS